MSSIAERLAALGRRVLGAAAVVLVLVGCATFDPRFKEVDVKPDALAAYLDGKPEPLKPHYAVLLRQGPRNAVLNEMRIGLAATDLGARDAAAEAFDHALQSIESVYAGTETAGKARQLWNAEAYKDFKGEPYERAMAYYYRGLLYLYQGDYENARASFKGGLLQDAFAEEEQNRADFALLTFLEGWASRCAGSGGLAADSFAETTKLKPGLAAPDASHDVVLLAETGSAPEKFGDGPKRSLLRIRRGADVRETKVRFEVAGQSVAAFPVEDVYFQASTRGGRPVDHILAGKVSFKETAATTGTVLKTVGVATLVGGAAGRSSEAAIAGGVLTIAGFIAEGMSNAVRPEADARYWDNLPDAVHVATISRPPAPGPVRVQFLDASGQVLDRLTRTTEVAFAGRCGVAWTRSRGAVPASPQAPGTTAITGQ